LRGFAAKMLDLPEPHAQDRGHCAHAHWYCFLHVFTAVTNRAHGVSKLRLQEMGSRYLFIAMYCWLEKYFSRGDYHAK